MADSQYYIPVMVDVRPASSAEQGILDNLFQLYAHDMSEFLEIELDDEGKFHYPPLPEYWTDAERFPFIIEVRGNLGGFALVRRIMSTLGGGHNTMDVAEFFILRSCRRLGVGMKAASDIWNRFPGTWQVRVLERNRAAAIFWRKAVEEFTRRPTTPKFIQMNGGVWQVFVFTSPSH